MNKQLKNILLFGGALILPIILFATTLLNERYPILPFLVCIPLFALAAHLSFSKVEKEASGSEYYKWLGWSAFIGLVEALLITFA